MSKAVIWNGTNLNAEGGLFSVTSVDMYRRAPRALQLEDLAGQEGSIYIPGGSQTRAKPLPLKGELAADTPAELEAAIDQLHRMFESKRLGILDIEHAGEIRRFNAVADQVDVNREGKGLWAADYSVRFVVPDGYGYALTPTTALEANITADYASLAMDIEGSVLAMPDITLTINSVTGNSTLRTITINNPANYSYVAIQRLWNPGDVVNIFTSQRRVYVNNSLVESAGLFPYWEPELGGLEYTDSFTSRDVDINVSHTRRYR